MKSLLLCVTYIAKAGQKEAFVREVEACGILDKIRHEDGCLCYDYFYPASGADEVLLVEKWASAEQQQAHQNQPHMAELMTVKAKYITDTKLVKAYMDEA